MFSRRPSYFRRDRLCTLTIVAGLISSITLLIAAAPRATNPDAGAVAPSTTTDYAYRPIEEIQVGDRVTTEVTDHVRQLAREYCGTLPSWDGRLIEPHRFRRVELSLRRDNGTDMQIVLLRPVEWLQENGIVRGASVPLSLPEMHQQGLASVQRVSDCPPIRPGAGRLVTGTFASTVHEIVELHLDGIGEPIRCTPEHPFYTISRDQFVPASELQPGERVEHLTSDVCVSRIIPRQGTFRVHNLEVQGDHVFRVSWAGVLVHNTYPGDLGDAIGRGMGHFSGRDAPDRMVDVMENMGRPMSRTEIGEVIHKVKDDPTVGLGAADDLVFDHSGGLWNSLNGEYLGKIWEW